MLVRYIIVVFFMVLVVGGCASTAPTTKTDSVRVVKEIEYRNIYSRDSMFSDHWHTIYMLGDTIYKHDSTVHHHYYYYHHTDTIHHTDTTYIDNTTTATVECKLTTWQKWIQNLGYGALGTLASILIAGIFWIIIKVK